MLFHRYRYASSDQDVGKKLYPFSTTDCSDEKEMMMTKINGSSVNKAIKAATILKSMFMDGFTRFQRPLCNSVVFPFFMLIKDLPPDSPFSR